MTTRATTRATPRTTPGGAARARAARLLLLVLAGLTGLLTAAPGAHAAWSVAGWRSELGPAAVVVVDRLSPDVAAPQTELTVAGRVVNRGTDPLDRVTIQVRLRTEPVGTRGELAELAAATDRPPGVVVAVTAVSDRLPPGGRAPFTLTVPLAPWGLRGFAVYPLAVEARATRSDGTRDRVATARTFLVVSDPTRPDEAPPEPTRVTVLWPVVPRAVAGTADGTAGAVDGRLELTGPVPAEARALRAQDLAPGGRLDRLVAAGRDRPVTWLVDGEALEPAGDTGPSQADAESRFAARLRTALAPTSTSVLAVAYADPDLAAALRAGLGQSVDEAQRLGTAVVADALGRAVADAPAWPVDGALPATPDAGLPTDLRTVLVSSTLAPPVGDLPYTPDAVGTLPDGTRAVVVDDPLSAVLAAGPREGGGILSQQRLVAETALVAQERPAQARSLVLAPPRTWDPPQGWPVTALDTLAGLPWVSLTPLGSLLAQPGAPPARQQPAYPGALARRELAVRQTADVALAQRRLGALAQVVADAQPVVDSGERTVLRGLSASWRPPATGGPAFARSVAGSLAQLQGGVRLLPADDVTLTARTGRIPVTIENTLPEAATVRVSLRADPAVRLALGDPGTITVPAGRRATVEVPAEASANGVVQVIAGLTTAQGAAFGTPVRFTVTVTGLGQVARAVVMAAFVLLAVLLVVRIVRRVRAGRPA